MAVRQTEDVSRKPLQKNLFTLTDRLRVLLLANPLMTSLFFVIVVWFSVAGLELHYEYLAKDHNINNFEDAVWWGIVTLLTVGYGDKYPVTTEGRLCATLLMISGVCGIAIVTAKISSFFLERALRERRGFVDTNTLKNHFVICGWKDEMVNFLIHMLDSNPHIKDSDLVLVCAAPDSEIDKLHDLPRLKRVKVIRGEHYLELNLRRAAPDKAMKILILADSTPGPTGEIPTITEADARTIMTAMALNTIARGVPMAAEIIDASMDQYLRLAHVNEIIYSRDVSRMLLATATGGVGIANVFHELLDPRSGAFIATRALPAPLLGQKYEVLQDHYNKEQKNRETLIGILQNSGNSHVAKEAALKRAQQTPNVAELVKNLQTVKALKFNHPVFNPPRDMILEEGARAIIIEHREDSSAGNV